LPEVWKEIEGRELYAAESLEKEGFIHCSFVGQLKGVLERYYPDAETVILLEIDPEKLQAKIKLEESTDDELFPHIYGEINLDAVVSVSVRNSSGAQNSDAGYVH